MSKRNIQKIFTSHPSGIPNSPQDTLDKAGHVAPCHHRVNVYFQGLAHVQSKTWRRACCLPKLGKKHLQHYEKHIVKGNTCKLNLLSYE